MNKPTIQEMTDADIEEQSAYVYVRFVLLGVQDRAYSVFPMTVRRFQSVMGGSRS